MSKYLITDDEITAVINTLKSKSSPNDIEVQYTISMLSNIRRQHDKDTSDQDPWYRQPVTYGEKLSEL